MGPENGAGADCELSPCEIWSSLTAVEETAVHVALYRYYGCQLPDKQTPLYDNAYDKAIVEACMPAEEQAKRVDHVDAHSMLAVRTAEIDEQLLKLVEADPELTQVVCLGAGLDNRAWRLHWPNPDITVFEVDTGSLEIIKQKALANFHLRCKRVFVQADLTKVDDLQARLVEGGFKQSATTVWLLEGLVGYLTPAQSYALFRMMHTMSPVPSKVIMTCPPNNSDREASLKQGVTLHHVTFEEASDTFRRLQRAGWSGYINKAEDLTAKYGIAMRQSQVIAHKAHLLPLAPAQAAAAVGGTLVAAGVALVSLLIARRKR